MKLDMDLVRKILLAIEESEDENIELDRLGDDLDRVYRHVARMKEFDLVDATIILGGDGPVEGILLCEVKYLTGKGHEFLEKARDESIWKEAKRICMKKTGGLALVALDSVLTDIIEIREYWPNNGQAISPVGIQAEKDSDTAKIESRRIFLVHGRDEGAKNTVARFLEKLDLQPVILDEQANRGLTIIEKFESHSDVGFAIVLLTPDDEGALRGGEESGRHRARQNVIFELGFFIGRLGRQRVCALTKGSAMEIPSDYSGVVYIPLDGDGAWQSRLVKELKAAGLDVDANRAL